MRAHIVRIIYFDALHFIVHSGGSKKFVCFNLSQYIGHMNIIPHHFPDVKEIEKKIINKTAAE